MLATISSVQFLFVTSMLWTLLRHRQLHANGPWNRTMIVLRSKKAPAAHVLLTSVNILTDLETLPETQEEHLDIVAEHWFPPILLLTLCHLRCVVYFLFNLPSILDAWSERPQKHGKTFNCRVRTSLNQELLQTSRDWVSPKIICDWSIAWM